MAKYTVYKDSDGNLSARTDRYTPKDGEKKVGTAEGETTEEALSAYESGEGQDADASRQPTEQDREQEMQRLHEEEDAKEDFTVMATADGQLYVDGDEGSDPAKQKSKAQPKAKKEDDEPVEVGSFRAKDAQEALKIAKGEAHNPAEGAPRGAQTP